MSNLKDIAIIGMAGRFPGAATVEQFWQNLLEGKETIHHFSDAELEPFEIDFANLKNNPNFVKARGIIEDIDKWDAKFFGYTPIEAAHTDPQHRLWLETAWHALEDAGCNPHSHTGSIGVFAGSYINTYLINNILKI